MRARILSLLVAASATATFAGCQDPEIVPVAPPGLEISRVPVVAPGEGAQAIGEQGTGSAPRQSKAQPTGKAAGSAPTPIGKPVTTASGLVYETLKEGTGPIAQKGQTVTIHYTGTLASDGSQFDSSRINVLIGVGKVIPGWDEGVPGMKVGERRKLTIPAALAYGSESPSRKIPPNSDLVFDVELLDVK